MSDSTTSIRRWRNLLKASELPWLDGHRLQTQMVFPVAGYIAMALEAAGTLVRDREVELFEVCDLVINKAISFEDDAGFSVETLISLAALTPVKEHEITLTQSASFSCHASPNNGSSSRLELVSTATITVVYGTPSPTTLTSYPLDTSAMNDIDAEQFYASISNIGYGYTGPFRAMSSIKREIDKASALISVYREPNDDTTQLLVHPSWLDMVIQSSLAAIAHPEDNNFRSLSVPTLIGCVRLNPKLCAEMTTGILLPMYASIHRDGTTGFAASIDVFSEDARFTLLQVEDLAMKPLTLAAVEDDRSPFTFVQWGNELPNVDFMKESERPSAEEGERAMLCERLSYFYLRKWMSEITEDEWARGETPPPSS